MTKINYKKVEEQLAKGLQKMFVQRIQEKAKKVQEAGGAAAQQSAVQEEGETRVLATDRKQSHVNLLAAVQRNLKRLMKKDDELHKELGLTEQELSRLVEDPSKLNTEEWEQLKKLKEDIEARGDELSAGFETDERDEEIIEEQKKRHFYKRHNTRKNWIPLDGHAPPSQKKRRPGEDW